MKVIVYIDGEHNTVEVKDKIKSVLPDANYMIFGVEDENALAVIKKQQAEIERLQKAYKQCAWERDVFAEDMKEEIKKDCSYLALDIKTIKAEAIKELESKLIERFKRLEHAPRTNRKTLRIEEVNATVNTVLQVAVPNIINQVVKEMVGDTE